MFLEFLAIFFIVSLFAILFIVSFPLAYAMYMFVFWMGDKFYTRKDANA